MDGNMKLTKIPQGTFDGPGDSLTKIHMHNCSISVIPEGLDYFNCTYYFKITKCTKDIRVFGTDTSLHKTFKH